MVTLRFPGDQGGGLLMEIWRWRGDLDVEQNLALCGKAGGGEKPIQIELLVEKEGGTEKLTEEFIGKKGETEDRTMVATHSEKGKEILEMMTGNYAHNTALKQMIILSFSCYIWGS